MLKGALNQKQGCAYADGIIVAAEGFDFFRIGVVATGGRLFHQATCPLQKKVFWLDGSLGFETRIIGIALADGFCDLGGKSLQLKASMIGDGGPCPFLIIPWQ
jgi:hypothetical protein